MDIENAVVIVTGASSGIGEATARRAAAVGAKVVMAARRTDRIERLAAELPDALAVGCDVTRPADVARVVAATLERHGRIDVLVNNAGQGLHVPIEQIQRDDFTAILDLNVVAPLVFMQAVIPTMRALGAGSIVNVSSGTTLLQPPGNAGYVASKAALNSLSTIARKELASSGISVSLILPFITSTEFHSVLRAGTAPTLNGRSLNSFPPQSAELVADAILDLVRTGEAQTDLVPRALGGTYEGPAAPVREA